LQQLIIEPLNRSHIPQIIEIEKQSFPDPWTEEKFIQEIDLKFSHFYVAKVNDEIAGYAGFWHITEEANIVNIAVKKAYRRQGIGKNLLEYLIESAKQKKISDMYLEVRLKNTTAQELYKKYGFEVCFTRKKYYNDDDGLIMYKKIS